MSATEAMLAFANLYEIAGLSEDTYGSQDGLIEECRRSGQRFLVIMPMRHRVRCEVCGVLQGESILHFEDPGQDPGPGNAEWLWPSTAGRAYETRRSVLYGVVAHGQELPTDLRELFANVRT